MYNQMVVSKLGPDGIFHALADGTRRDIVARCAREGLSVSALAKAYPMSFAAVQKHVAVLHRVGLVHKQRRGREQLVTTELPPLRAAQQQLADLETAWRSRLDRMAQLLVDEHDTEGKQT